jgi:hypothetical protein
MDYYQVRYGRVKDIPVLDAMDVEEVYGYSASHYHCIQQHIGSYGWRYVSFGQD